MRDSSEAAGPVRSPVVESLFPGVAAAAYSSTAALLDETDIETYEAESTEKFAPSRRAEFITGRTCARDAMNLLGVGRAPIPVGSRREPLWPHGIIGSISHTRRGGRYYVAAAVAQEQESGPRIGIGLDAEVIQRLDQDVRRRILTDAEIEIIDALPEPDRDLATIRVFSAKEAFYKAQYPITGAWVGFEDMWMPTIGRLSAGSLHQTGDHEALGQLALPVTVRQVVHDGLVISGVVATATT